MSAVAARAPAALSVVVVIIVLGCSSYRLPPRSPRLSELPARLSETGLYDGERPIALARGVRAYVPAHELWSDGAQKLRWIRLPAGTRIDSADMDSWDFPVGTRLWKEFSRDGRPIETRLLAWGMGLAYAAGKFSKMRRG